MECKCMFRIPVCSDEAVHRARMRLDDLTATMEIPPMRTHDYRWLGRNLGSRNRDHDGFVEALRLLRVIMPEGLIVGEAK